MKIRSQLFSVLALVCLALGASAQTRSTPRYTPKRVAAPVQEFGSVARTKLLQMARGSSGSEAARQLGSVQRRALLTTGKAIQLPVKQKSRVYRRR